MQEILSETVTPKGELENLSSEQLKEIIKNAGMVGMGGATFPTHVKLALPPEKQLIR